MVTGGFPTAVTYLDTTGVYTEGEGWRIVSGRLPVAIRSPALVNFGNRVILFGIYLVIYSLNFPQIYLKTGGFDERSDYKVIQEYNPDEETWTKIGDMTLDRFNHAASIVPFNEFKDHFLYCLSN